MPEGQDHVISARHEFPSTPIARWDANVAAIRLVNELEREKRRATPAEQRVLGQYSGFGDSAFESAFSGSRHIDPAWQRRKDELESLVAADDLEGIRRSRLNAFYTTPEVVKSMWSTLSGMGANKLENPKVLEPSAGSGRFLGLQPSGMAERSSRVAVELDPRTADILKHLYPETKVYKAGFQEAPVPDDHFDIAISNVPFGNIKVYDKEFNATGRKYLTNSIHNYFFAKTLDKLRPGGVMAFITSHHTMDAPKAEPVRRYLADRADLVGAVRLPEDAFPDTQVVTDVIYLRKRSEGEESKDDSWVKSEPIELSSRWSYRPQRAPINRYFIDNPDKVLGQHSAEGSMYGANSYTVKSSPNKPFQSALTKESGKVARRGDITPYTPPAAATAVTKPTVQGAPKYVIEGDSLRVKQDGTLSDHDLDSKHVDRVKALVGLRDAARRLVEQEGSDTDNSTVESTRASLQEQYDEYVETYGEAINTPANRKLLGNDADDHLLFALESYDKSTECWRSADIMRKRVVGAVPAQKVNDASDAMSVVMNETGKVDFAKMGAKLGRSAEDVRDELEEDQLVFKSPDGDSWIPRAEYLSGNVREKLRQAQVAADSEPSFKNHVEALEQVQPARVAADEIATPLGAPWIPADVINRWVDEHFRPYNRSYAGEEPTEYFRYVSEGEAFVADDEKGKSKRVGATGSGGSWTLANKISANAAVMENEWGTKQVSANDILLKTLQGAPIAVTKKDDDGKRIPDQAGTLAAQEKAAAMQKSFEEWVWKDQDRRQRLEKVYNDTHNAMRPRDFDGSHQTFPAMSVEWQQQMRPHQRDAIYRTVTDGTALLAHEVGFGKTATMVASAMERKRLGLANKPVFVVPKATHEQFVGDFMEIYPGARLLAPDESDFKVGNREQFLSRIATGDWDGVVLTMEQFEKIPLSPETEMKWIAQQRAEMLGALLEIDGSSTESKRTQKQIQKKIENYETRLKQLRDRMRERSDDAQTFESLGVDQLYVDEADNYKNLPYVTRMGAGRSGVKGLPQSESQRAWDMYMKIRYLQDKAGTKPDGSFARGGVVFATGTPVANTIAETWTMMRYLQPNELKRRGLDNFDAWAKTYAKIAGGIEQTAAGTFKPVQRFKQFVNLPELGQLFQNVADIRVASEVPRMLAAQPRLLNKEGENKRITVVAPAHPALEQYMAEIVKRVDTLGHKDPRDDNMLKISSDARKAALDVRMVEPNAPYNQKGKIALAAENIAEIYKQETPDKGTQLVFLDMGTPKAAEGKDSAPAGDQDELTGDEQQVLTNVYGTLRRELAAKGVPEDQVAFAQDYKTPAARESLFDQVRSGDVRVLVGSTQKIGVGVNVQNRAAAAHHIDVPWRPRDVEQREGRIIRQGNEVYGPVLDDETGERVSPGRGVKIFQYVQEKSFDGFMWQAVESKARSIKALMKREQTERDLGDIDPFVIGAAEAKALATGNPLAGRAVQLQTVVAQGRLSREAHRKQVEDARAQKSVAEQQIGRYRSTVPTLEADSSYVKNLTPADFEATIKGKSYVKRKDAAAALQEALKKVPYRSDDSEATPIGEFKGFNVEGINSDRGYQIVVSRPETGQDYTSAAIPDGDMSAAGLMTRLDNLVKSIPKRAEKARVNLEEAESSRDLYETQIAKSFQGVPELSHAEKQLRVIQARLSDDKEALLEGDDWDMDVMSDWKPERGQDTEPATPAPVADTPDSPREAPDVDAIDLKEAVEAVRSPEKADTPAEVSDALQDELAPDTPAPEPEAKPAVERPVSQAQTAPSEVKAPLDELDALASEFNFDSFQDLDVNLKAVILELYRSRAGLPKETAVAPDVPAARVVKPAEADLEAEVEDSPQPRQPAAEPEPDLAAATAEVKSAAADGTITAAEAKTAADDAAKVLSAAAQETPDSPEPLRSYDSDDAIARLVREICDNPEEMRKVLARAQGSRSDAESESREHDGQQNVSNEARSAAGKIMSRLSQDAPKPARSDDKPAVRKARVSDEELLRRAAKECERDGQTSEVVKEVEAFLRAKSTVALTGKYAAAFQRFKAGRAAKRKSRSSSSRRHRVGLNNGPTRIPTVRTVYR